MSTLDLQFAGLTLIISRFNTGNFPRDRIDGPAISRSTYGSPIRRGTAYEAPHIWEVDAVLSRDDMETLEAMHGAYISSPAAVRVIDKVRKFSEPSPRSRAIALGEIESTKSTQVLYFAQFDAEFQGPLSITQKGQSSNWHDCAFQLIETTKVVA